MPVSDIKAHVGGLDWDLPSPFLTLITVSPDDIDGLGHANNAAYVVWCELCAWRHSENLGLSVKDYQRLDRGVAIHQADYTYLQPCFSGDSLAIGTWLVKCDGRLRLERNFQIINQNSGETLLRGRWQLVSVILSSGKPTRLPPEFVKAYTAAVIEVPFRTSNLNE
ncbi:MAG: thioesterase family protein [Pseudohongiellaceae bacterium]